MVTTHGDSFCYVIDALIWLEHFTATEIELKILLIIATLQTLSIQCVIKEQKKTTWWVAQVPTDRPTANYDSWWFFVSRCICFNMPKLKMISRPTRIDRAHDCVTVTFKWSINDFNKLIRQKNWTLNKTLY